MISKDAMWYRLVGHTPVPCESLAEAERALASDRRVAYDRVGEVEVSTVFLSLDLAWSSDGPPLLFETMIFGGERDERQWRYSTWDEALVGHSRALALVKGEEEE